MASMPKKNGRRGGKRGGQTRVTTVVTSSEALERSLASRADATPLMGKLIFSTNTTANVVLNILTVAPTSFGVRAAALNVLFARYRFKFLNIKFFYQASPAGAGVCALGVLDDFSGEGDSPTTASGVLELRSSGTNLGGTTIPTEIMWRPVTQNWNFCTPGSTGSDQRLVAPASTYLCSTATGSVTIEIVYSVVFKGAVDTGTI